MWSGRSSDASLAVSMIAAKMLIFFLSWCLIVGAQAQDAEETPFIYEEKYEVCTTEACHTTAAEILNGMDHNTEPCVDFYNFVCKNWRYNHPDIPNVPERNQFIDAELSFLWKMKRILETSEDDTTNESEGLKLSKQLYDACMNNDTIEQQVSMLKDVVANAGNWPLANPTAETSMTPENIDFNLSQQFGISWLYELDFAPYIFDWGRNILTIKPPRIVRPPFVDGSVEGKRKYADIVDKVVRMFLGEKEYAALNKVTLTKEIYELIEFEDAAAAAFDTNQPHCDYITETLTGLQNAFAGVTQKSKVDWMARLKPLLPSNKDDPIYITCPKQIEMIVTLTANFNDRTIKNYVIWNFLKHTLLLIDTGLKNTLYPANSHKLRWQQCVEENEALSAVYYHILEEDARNGNDKKALDIYDAMEAMTAWRFLGLKDRLRGNNLRLDAYELHEEMTLHFKNAEPYFNATDYVKQFPHVNASELYVENILAKMKFQNERIATMLSEPVEIEKAPEFQVTPHEVKVQGGAFNKGRFVPAGALEMPFYHKDRPQSVNYGALGSVLGRSFMTEYYDYLVASYYGDRRIVGYPEVGIKSFKNNAMYILNQWDDYPLKNKESKEAVDVQDMNAVYSHHAQSDAVKAAFEAYEREFKLRRWKDVRLPGLEKYDHRQLFFLSYVNAHCAAPSRLGLTKIEDISRAVLAELDMEARRKVILSLIQTEQFSEVFKCKLGTWMYPFEVTRFW